MNRCEKKVRKRLMIAVSVMIAFLTLAGGCNRTKQHRQNDADTVAAASSLISPFSANDVSLLFPAPVTAADFGRLIAVSDLTTPDPQDPARRNPVWPDAAFQQFVANADGPAAQVAGTDVRITLPDEAKIISAWFVAGIRIDAGAPGLAPYIRDQYGESPEIRLIIQPATRSSNGSPKVLDIAGHLIFDFVTTPIAPAQSGCLPRPSPDRDAFNSIVLDLSILRNRLREGQIGPHKIVTAGTPLGVHPGLRDPDTAVSLRNELKSFLEKHISCQRLDAMSIVGLPSGAPAPWIFLSMLKIPGGSVAGLPNGGFVPVHGPTLDGDRQFAQMLHPVGTNPRVVPDPHNNNLNPITCRNGAVSPTSLPIGQRNGAATAELFTNSFPTPERTSQILDVVPDPNKSHFFNTDCVSCHTETRRAMELQNMKAIPGIDTSALPNGPWNVRNFGWSPSRNGLQATVTRRTANETASVVNFINSEVLNKSLH